MCVLPSKFGLLCGCIQAEVEEAVAWCKICWIWCCRSSIPIVESLKTKTATSLLQYEYTLHNSIIDIDINRMTVILQHNAASKWDRETASQSAKVTHAWNIQSTCKLLLLPAVVCVKTTVNLLPTWCYASMVFSVITCLSVHPSITSRCCMKTAKHRIMQTPPHDSPARKLFITVQRYMCDMEHCMLAAW